MLTVNLYIDHVFSGYVRVSCLYTSKVYVVFVLKYVTQFSILYNMTKTIQIKRLGMCVKIGSCQVKQSIQNSSNSQY